MMYAPLNSVGGTYLSFRYTSTSVAFKILNPRCRFYNRLLWGLGKHKLNPMKKILQLTTIAVFVFLSACKKGEVGPAGLNGKDGNANVTSQEFVIGPSDWTAFGTFGQPGFGYSTTITAPSITQDILDHGAVMVYYKPINTSNYTALPFTVPINGNYSTTFLFIASAGYIQLKSLDSDTQTLLPADIMYIKVVAIDGSQRIANPNLDLKDYEKVRVKFDL